VCVCWYLWFVGSVCSHSLGVRFFCFVCFCFVTCFIRDSGVVEFFQFWFVFFFSVLLFMVFFVFCFFFFERDVALVVSQCAFDCRSCQGVFALGLIAHAINMSVVAVRGAHVGGA